MSTPEEREQERQAAIARNKRDAAPIIRELRSSGFDIEAVADLYNKRFDYRSAIPVLVSWLPNITNADVKEDLVRALSIKWAKEAAPLLIDEFEKADKDPEGLGLRWAIGNALRVLASNAIADDLIRLATDRRYRRGREMVVLGLGKVKNDARVKAALLKLLDDEEVVGHAVAAVGQLGLQAARPQLDRLLNHSKASVRTEAQRALKKLGVRIPELADEVAIHRYRERGKTLDTSELTEASTEFDLEDVQKFFLGIAALVTKGFVEIEANNLTYLTRDMEHDTTERFGFDVEFRGGRYPLYVEIFIDDIDSPAIYCFTGKPLADEIDKLMEEIGRIAEERAELDSR